MGDATARILHLDLYLLLIKVVGRVYLYLNSSWCEFKGIFDQVNEDLLEASLVTDEHLGEPSCTMFRFSLEMVADRDLKLRSFDLEDVNDKVDGE